MRRLNFRLALALFGLAAALAVGLFATNRLQKDRIAAALLAQAHAAESQGKTADAIKLLGRYLEFQPSALDERARLGRLLAAKESASNPKAVARATHVLEGVLGRDPDRRAERRLLVALALDNKDLVRANEHLSVLERSAEPDADAAELRGRYHAARDEHAAAADCYRKAIAADPRRVEARLRLADLLRRHGDEATRDDHAREAAALLDAAVAADPEAWRVRLARWNHRREFDDLQSEKAREDAARDVEHAQKLAPDESPVVAAVADLARRRGKDDEARAVLDKGLRARPKDVTLHRARAALEVDAGRRAAAAEALRHAEQNVADTSRFEFQWALVHLLTEAKASGPENAEAGEIVARVRRGPATSAAADYLNGRVLHGRRRWAEAAQVLEQARPGFEREPKVAGPLDALLAECYREMSDWERHAVVCRRIVAAGPTGKALLALASAEMLAGRVAPAVEAYRRAALQKETSVDARLQLARVLLDSGRGAETGEEVERLLIEVEKVRPGAAEVPLLRAEALAAQGRGDDSVKTLEAVCRLDPKYERPTLHIGLALALGPDEQMRAKQILDDVEKKTGQRADLIGARALLALRGPVAEAAPTLTALEGRVARLKDDEQARVLVTLAEARTILGNFAEAEALYARAARLPTGKDDAHLHQTRGELAIHNGNNAGVGDALDALLRLEGPGGPSVGYLQALQQLALFRAKKGGDLAEAGRLLEKLGTVRPDADTRLAQAELAELQGRFDQAVAGYRQARTLGARDARVTRRLVELLARQQRYREAADEVQALLRQPTVSRGVRALAADVLLRSGGKKEALEQSMKAVPLNSTDYRDQLWLGMVRAVSGERPDVAELHLRRAVALAEAEPAPRVALIEFLAGQGRTTDAEKALDEAAVKLPAEKAPLALALGNEALGRRDRADALYLEVLKKQANDVAALRGAAGFFVKTSRPQLAEPLLRRLADKKDLPQANDDDAAFGRFGLAVVLAARGDKAGFDAAMPLVGLAYDAEGRVVDAATGDDPVEQRRARARVLASRPSRLLRLKAISLLEELETREGTLADGDRYLLSQLCESVEALPKAAEALARLAAARPGDSLYQIRYAQILLRLNRAGEARPIVERLEARERERGLKPGTLGTADLRARLLEAAGDGEKAVVLLQKHVATAQRPEEFLLLVQSLTRQRQFARAAALCEAAWGSCPAEIVAGTHVGVLVAGRLGGDETTRAERLLNVALEKTPQSPALLLALAGLKGLAGRFDDEEAAYRRVLAVDPRNVVALNNLAWLLSQRNDRGDEALALIGRAIDTFGRTPDLLDTRALVQLTLGRADRAKADLEESLADTPSAARYFHLARVLQKTGGAEAAKGALAKARALGLKRGQLHPVEQLACAQLLEGIEER